MTDEKQGLCEAGRRGPGVFSRHRVAVAVVTVIVGWLVYTMVISPPGPDDHGASGVSSETSYAPLPIVTSTRTPAPAPRSDAAVPDESDPIGGLALPESVASNFGRDFTDASPGWWERMARWTSPALAESYRSTSPDRLPTGRVAALAAHAVGNTVADFVVTYDTGFEVGVRVEYIVDQWRVTRAVPMDTAY